MHIALQSRDININHVIYYVGMYVRTTRTLCAYIFQTENVVYVENIACGDCEHPLLPQIQWSTIAPLNFIATYVHIHISVTSHNIHTHSCPTIVW